MGLNANELRIGNYVNYMDSEKKLTVSYHEIRYSQINSDNNYNPIPLTEDWLVSFGFYYSDDYNEFLEIDLMHRIKLYADYSNNFSTVFLRMKENEIEIKYVHQLQNLFFALTGKELTHQKIN